MTIPLSEVPNRKEQLASKPGYLVDRYIRIQEINNAVDACKEEIKLELNEILVEELAKKIVLDKIDKWLKVKIKEDKYET